MPKPCTPDIPPRVRPTPWSASSRSSNDALNDEVRHYARRHLLDTVGVMISGAAAMSRRRRKRCSLADAARRPSAGAGPCAPRRPDRCGVPWRHRAHGIELDDGYTKGSVHPGCTVVPAILSAGYVKKASGAQLIEAMVAGYETVTAIGRAVHPDLRHRGFHPTGAVAVFGAAMAVGKLRGLSPQQLSNALGIAGVELGRAVRLRQRRRRHQAAARRPRLARGLAGGAARGSRRRGAARRDRGARRLHAGLRLRRRPCAAGGAAADGPFGITDCYIKPNPCCRHIQPAVEALIGILNDEKIASDEVKHVAVETYRIAAEHAGTGWDDYASAQLSFKYLMALALKFRNIKVAYFEDAVRNDPGWAALAAKFEISAPHEIDRLYPKLRPARVTVTTARASSCGRPTRRWARGWCPLDDDGLKAKFHRPGRAGAWRGRRRSWRSGCGRSMSADVTPLIDAWRSRGERP